MDSLYTDEVKNYLRSRDWPLGLVWEIGESYEPEQHLNLVFFRDNWLRFDFEEQAKATSIVKEAFEHLWSKGIPIYVAKMESQYGN